MRMNPWLSFRRLSMIFLAVFAVLAAGAFLFDRLWVAPGDRCESEGGWYDITTRVCATPIYIPDITGRAEGESRADASARKAGELVELESRAAAIEEARDDQARRDREQYEAAKAAE